MQLLSTIFRLDPLMHEANDTPAPSPPKCSISTPQGRGPSTNALGATELMLGGRRGLRPRDHGKACLEGGFRAAQVTGAPRGDRLVWL